MFVKSIKNYARKDIDGVFRKCYKKTLEGVWISAKIVLSNLF